MWHIVLIGYLFVAVMYSAAQPSIARALIYLVLGSPTRRVYRFHRYHPPPQPFDEAAGKKHSNKAAAQPDKKAANRTAVHKIPFRRPLIRYNPSVFHFGNTLFLKLMPTFAEGCLTIGAAYQVLCD